MFGPKLTVPQLFARQRVVTRNQNRPVAATTAPPVADAEQAERDWYFNELVKECRAGHVRPSRIAWLLAESGRSESELWAAVERAEPNDGKPATSLAATLPPVCEKESQMTTQQKRQIESEWNAAVRAKQAEKPHWNKAKCISAVATERPDLHERLLEAANDR